MKMRFVVPILMLMLIVKPGHAAQSTITESEGYACQGEDKSRKQTEQAALVDARKKATEFVASHIKSETRLNNNELEKDIVEAYANAEVKVVKELEKAWYKDPSLGECYKVKITAEIIPDPKPMAIVAADTQASDSPQAPLKVKTWTDKAEYKKGDKIKIYLKGNKPFFARVIYKDVSGEVIQILPNPYRTENAFNGGVTYVIPEGNDQFDMEVSPPFGEENVIVYASTAPLGEIGVKTRGGVYQVKTSKKDIGMKTRSIKMGNKNESKDAGAATSEFFEDKVVLKTKK